MRSSMKSVGNSNINSRRHVSLILSYVRRKHVNVDNLKRLFTLLIKSYLCKLSMPQLFYHVYVLRIYILLRHKYDENRSEHLTCGLLNQNHEE